MIDDVSYATDRPRIHGRVVLRDDSLGRFFAPPNGRIGNRDQRPAKKMVKKNACDNLAWQHE